MYVCAYIYIYIYIKFNNLNFYFSNDDIFRFYNCSTLKALRILLCKNFSCLHF